MVNSKVCHLSANNNQRIIKIKKYHLKKNVNSYKIKDKIFKANTNMQCHVQFKSRYLIIKNCKF